MKKEIIRHAYDSSVDSLARLSTTAFSCGLTKLDDDIQEKVRQLVIHDLITLSISLRRLVEATSLVDFCKSIDIPLVWPSRKSERYSYARRDVETIWTMLGTIVHSRMHRLAQSEWDLAMLLGEEPINTMVKLEGSLGSDIEPICAIWSDRKQTCFALRDFVGRSGLLLQPARDAAQSVGMVLDLDMRHL